jgi:hypothetical protein
MGVGLASSEAVRDLLLPQSLAAIGMPQQGRELRGHFARYGCGRHGSSGEGLTCLPGEGGLVAVA